MEVGIKINQIKFKIVAKSDLHFSKDDKRNSNIFDIFQYC